MRVRALLTVGLTGLLAVGSIAGCSGGVQASAPTSGPPPASSPTGTPSPTAPPLFDPPRQFAEDGTRVGPRGAVVGGGLAFAPDDESRETVNAVDLGSGEKRWARTVEAPIGAGRASVSQVPALALVGGAAGTALAYAGIRVIEGTGTARDRRQVLVGALARASGEPTWSVPVDPPAGLDLEDAEVRVAGATEEHVVVAVRPDGIDEPPAAIVVDVAARRAAWTKRGFLAGGLDRRLILGVQVESSFADSGQPTALDVTTRAPVWTDTKTDADTLDVAQAAPAPGIAQFTVKDLFEPRTRLVDSRTGRLRANLPDRYHCVFDQQRTLVCPSFDTLLAVDATSAKTLWTITNEDAKRELPGYHAAYHGLIYADATGSEVILDARTGRDLVTDVTRAPDLVVPGYGLTVDTDGLKAYRATA